jgi:hypothetical protein
VIAAGPASGAVYDDPGEPDPAAPSNGYPAASRGGRWFRRGRHIVLTGL